jgi:hypothetical protein
MIFGFQNQHDPDEPPTCMNMALRNRRYAVVKEQLSASLTTSSDANSRSPRPTLRVADLVADSLSPDGIVFGKCSKYRSYRQLLFLSVEGHPP